MGQEKAKRNAQECKNLVPIWPNTENLTSEPSIAKLVNPKFRLPNLSWVNICNVYYVPSQCFDLDAKTIPKDQRLGYGSVVDIRKSFALNDNIQTQAKDVGLLSVQTTPSTDYQDGMELGNRRNGPMTVKITARTTRTGTQSVQQASDMAPNPPQLASDFKVLERRVFCVHCESIIAGMGYY